MSAARQPPSKKRIAPANLRGPFSAKRKRVAVAQRWKRFRLRRTKPENAVIARAMTHGRKPRSEMLLRSGLPKAKPIIPPPSANARNQYRDTFESKYTRGMPNHSNGVKIIISRRKTVIHIGPAKAKLAIISVMVENTRAAAMISRRIIRL